MKSYEFSPQQRSPIGKLERRDSTKFIVVPYPIPKGCTATNFPEANMLVSINSMAKKIILRFQSWW
jgi:hypothetical protein